MKILILCATGTSSSIVVDSIKRAIKGRNIEVTARGIEEYIDKITYYDLILLGPQIKYKIDIVQEAVKDKNIPVALIDSMDYGLCNGEDILNKAIQLINIYRGE